MEHRIIAVILLAVGLTFGGATPASAHGTWAGSCVTQAGGVAAWPTTARQNLFCGVYIKSFAWTLEGAWIIDGKRYSKWRVTHRWPVSYLGNPTGYVDTHWIVG